MFQSTRPRRARHEFDRGVIESIKLLNNSLLRVPIKNRAVVDVINTKNHNQVSVTVTNNTQKSVYFLTGRNAGYVSEK